MPASYLGLLLELVLEGVLKDQALLPVHLLGASLTEGAVLDSPSLPALHALLGLECG